MLPIFDKIMGMFDKAGEWKDFGIMVKDEIKVAVAKYKTNKHKFVILLNEILYNWNLVEDYLDGEWVGEESQLFNAMKTCVWKDLLNDKDVNIQAFIRRKVNRRDLPRDVDKPFKIRKGFTEYLGADFETLCSNVYSEIQKNKDFGKNYSKWDDKMVDFIKEFSILVRVLSLGIDE